ncbi:MAG: tetratricopeptide repeat protein [Desulfomonilia bacterium]
MVKLQEQGRDDKRPTLGVVMIVKNEEERLPLILTDIQGAVDEIVVVDTGSRDRSVEIARSYGAKTGFSAWCNDFSAARNESIRLAGSDYLLWLDADDRIRAEDREKIRELKKSLRPARDRGYLLRIMVQGNDDSDTVALQPRIFPNREGIVFEGRIHEQILPSMERSGVVLEKVDITIEHSGYHSPEVIREKAERNLKILMDESGRKEGDVMYLFRITMSYYALRDYEKCLEYLALIRRQTGTETREKYHHLVAAECYARMNKPGSALRELRNAVRIFPRSGVVQYFLGYLCLRINLLDEAITALGNSVGLGIEIENFPLPTDIREDLHYQYGCALEKVGRVREAVSAYQESLHANPGYTPALRALGMVLLNSGEVQKAISCLERAQQSAGKYDRQLCLSLARAYIFVGKFSDAHAVYLGSLQHDLCDMEVLSGAVQTSIETNDIQTLRSSIRTLVSFFGREGGDFPDAAGDYAGACAEIARVLLDRDDPLIAKRLADAALRMDETCAHAHLVCADIALVSGDVVKGISCMEKALSHGVSLDQITERMERIGTP